MRLNKTTSHAISLLVSCAKADDSLTKVTELAERLDITRQNAFKIVHLLSRAGFLTSVRGPNGGVRLAKPAEEIRIGDVVRSIEAGLGAKAVNGDQDKRFDSLIDEAFLAFLEVLDGQTIADMARANKRAKAKKKSRSATVKTYKASRVNPRARRSSSNISA